MAANGSRSASRQGRMRRRAVTTLSMARKMRNLPPRRQGKIPSLRATAGPLQIGRMPPLVRRSRFPTLFSLVVCALLAGCSGGTAGPAAETFCKEFSGERAFEHVSKLVAFGPRPSGSPELEQSRQYIEAQLRASGWTVERQRFTDPTPHGPIEFINLIARPVDAKPADAHAIVCTHYDTKYFAEQRFVGANDGGSGTGALIELARVLAQDKTFARRFELVFFDGEEAITKFEVQTPPYDGLYGSRHYAHALSEAGRLGQFKLGILWDMMGDRDLDVTLPPNSPPKLAQGLFAAGDALGTRQHFGYFNGDILDDHYYLNNLHIPTLDVIDFDFHAWHTPADTLDKVSAESLGIVSQATLYYLCKAAPDLR